MYTIEDKYHIPASWQIATLSEINAINPKTELSHLNDEDFISFVPMSLVEEHTGKLDPTNLEKVVKVKKGYTRFLEGDVLFAKITPCMETGSERFNCL